MDEPEMHDQAEEQPERFAIRDEATAAWAVGKIAEARAVLEQRRQAAAAWVEEAEREVARLEGRFVAELRLWAAEHLPAGKRSIRLMTGRLEFRTTPGRFVVSDPEEALAWARQYLPAAIKIEERLLAGEIAAYAQTGEVPPGVEWSPEGESFKVK